MDIKTKYLSAPLSTMKANVSAVTAQADERFDVHAYAISSWDDEISELHDAKLYDEYRTCMDKNRQDREKFVLANPMSSEYEKNEYYYYETMNKNLEYACRDEKYPDIFDNDDLRWAFGKTDEFGSWKKTQKAIEQGLADKRTLKQVEEYENNFSQSFANTESELQSIKRKRVYSDNGAELDIDRVMSGDENYWSSRKKTGKAQVIRLGIDVGVSWDNKTSTFAKITGIGIALAREIQKKGYSLEIYKVGRTRGSQTSFVFNQRTESKFERPERAILAKHDDDVTIGFKTCLKGSQQAIDLERISNVGLEGVFRGCTFRSQGMALGGFNGYARGEWTEMDLEVFGLDCVVSKRWVDGDQKTMISNLKKKLGI
jgi:hypothetical protein